MKKLVYSVAFGLLLCGCSARYTDVTDTFKMPPELKDYKVITLFNGDTGLYVLVKRSGEDREVIGTTRPGKGPIHTIVVDGKEYTEKQ